MLNRDFEETCVVSSDLRSVLFLIFNPVRDELITGGVGGTKVRAGEVQESLLGIKAVLNGAQHSSASLAQRWPSPINHRNVFGFVL